MVVSYAAHDRHLTSVARVQMLGSTQEDKMSDQDWPKKYCRTPRWRSMSH